MAAGRGAGIAGLVVVLTACASAPASKPLSPPATQTHEILFDVDGGVAQKIVDTFRRRLQAAGLRANVVARGDDTIAVRLLGGNPWSVVELAGHGSVRLTSLDDAMDLTLLGASLPAGVEIAVDSKAVKAGVKGAYLRASAALAPTLRDWLSKVKLSADQEALLGDDDEEASGAYVRAFVVGRETLASGADVRDLSVGEEEEGPYVSVTFDTFVGIRVEGYLREHAGKRLALVSGDRVIFAGLMLGADPVVPAIIGNGVRISMGQIADGRERRDRLRAALQGSVLSSPLRLRRIDPPAD